ncbi:MAG: SDR family NAD(P)-dependent oxidoreductase [Candidatus Dependentiae bacterium]|jgi:UDP-glucose 4-epimerase
MNTTNLSLTNLHTSYYKNKTVLVTGGAGFIGSHIVDRLVACGADVRVMDNLRTGRIDNLFTSAQQVTFQKADIRDATACEKLTAGVSHIFHTAAMVSVPESIDNPQLCEDINNNGTRTLYEAAGRNSVQSIVFSSSCAVYGAREGVCKEEDETAPSSPYAQSKLTGEQLGKAIAQRGNISVANLRYFNVHGPRQSALGPYAGVVAAFTKRLKKGDEITIHGDGSQTRDFIHVDDVVTANLQAGLATQLRGQTINVASGTSVTLLELLKNLEHELGVCAPTITHGPARAGDIQHSQAATDRLARLLAFRPQSATQK